VGIDATTRVTISISGALLSAFFNRSFALALRRTAQDCWAWPHTCKAGTAPFEIERKPRGHSGAFVSSSASSVSTWALRAVTSAEATARSTVV
jgi:hypothetical protein